MAELLRLATLALLAVAAGASFATQAAVNASLRAGLGSPAWAAFVSYAGGTLAMLAVLLATRAPWPGEASVSASGSNRDAWPFLLSIERRSEASGLQYNPAGNSA